MSVCPTTNVLKSTYQHNIPTLHTNTTFQWKYSHIVEHQEFKLYHALTQEEDNKVFLDDYILELSNPYTTMANKILIFHVRKDEDSGIEWAWYERDSDV